MKNKVTYLIAFLFCLHLSFSQEENIHNQSPNTLVDFDEIIDHYKNLNDTDSNLEIYSSTCGYLSLIKSGGKTRKISEDKMNWLEMILGALNVFPNPRALFENEVLITTENGSYWIPIQKELYGYWVEEMGEDTQGLIYIRTFGSIKDNEDNNKWIFTINSFNSNYFKGLWDEIENNFDDGDDHNALNCIKKLIDLDPNESRIYGMYGYYFYKKGYPNNRALLKKADSLYDISIKLATEVDFALPYYQKMIVNYMLEDFVTAWDMIEKIKSIGQESIIQERVLIDLESKLPYADYLKTKNRSSE